MRALSARDWAIEQAMSLDPEVVKWTYYPSEMTEADSRRRIDRSLERSKQGLVRRYVISGGGDEPVGTCGIGELQSDCPRVSYAVLPHARRRGFATRVTLLLAEWALAVGYPTVSLETIEGNVASEGVAIRAGFAPVERYLADHRGRKAWLTLWTRAVAD